MYRVEPLAKRHVRALFACGNAALDTYIRTVAGQDERRDVASVFVATEDDRDAVCGYYALAAHTALFQELPAKFQKRLPRYPAIPVALLGRLAVDTGHRGRHLGEQLLIDALRRAARASQQVATAAVVVEAIDDAAAAFYAGYGFEPLDGARGKLYLPMGTIRQLWPED